MQNVVLLKGLWQEWPSSSEVKFFPLSLLFLATETFLPLTPSKRSVTFNWNTLQLRLQRTHCERKKWLLTCTPFKSGCFVCLFFAVFHFLCWHILIWLINFLGRKCDNLQTPQLMCSFLLMHKCFPHVFLANNAAVNIPQPDASHRCRDFTILPHLPSLPFFHLVFQGSPFLLCHIQAPLFGLLLSDQILVSRTCFGICYLGLSPWKLFQDGTLVSTLQLQTGNYG